MKVMKATPNILFVSTLTISSIALFSCVSTRADAEQLTVQQLEQQANQKIGQFSQALKGQLQTAIKQGGLPAAVSVCKSVAPVIAAENSNDGWTLKRTSLKVRNTSNMPDPWELTQLSKFEQIKASGKQATDTPMVASTYKVNGDQTDYRYMKVIPTQALCLECHGSNINPELRALINQAYPDDKAINFQLGDIRGAFSLQKIINSTDAMPKSIGKQ